MWWRLIRPSPKSEPNAPGAIRDKAGTHYLDSNYITLGVSEGWLVRVGWFYNEKGILVWEYRAV